MGLSKADLTTLVNSYYGSTATTAAVTWETFVLRSALLISSDSRGSVFYTVAVPDFLSRSTFLSATTKQRLFDFMYGNNRKLCSYRRRLGS